MNNRSMSTGYFLQPDTNQFRTIVLWYPRNLRGRLNQKIRLHATVVTSALSIHQPLLITPNETDISTITQDFLSF